MPRSLSIGLHFQCEAFPFFGCFFREATRIIDKQAAAGILKHTMRQYALSPFKYAQALYA
jgi:hypothetical protein